MRFRRVFISWDRVLLDTRTLVGRLPQRNFRKVVGVGRGGLIPAALISQHLDCRIIETICAESYAGVERQECRILKWPEGLGSGEESLIVDDLVDSGATFRALRTVLPQALFACLYAKPAGREAADFFAVEFPQEQWLVFPWELPL